MTDSEPLKEAEIPAKRQPGPKVNRDGPNQTIPTTVKNSGLSPKRSITNSTKNESADAGVGNSTS